jgi:hypothetical protein
MRNVLVRKWWIVVLIIPVGAGLFFGSVALTRWWSDESIALSMLRDCPRANEVLGEPWEARFPGFCGRRIESGEACVVVKGTRSAGEYVWRYGKDIWPETLTIDATMIDVEACTRDAFTIREKSERCEHGDAALCLQVGDLFARAGDQKNARAFYLKGCEHDQDACDDAASRFERGDPGPKDAAFARDLRARKVRPK